MHWVLACQQDIAVDLFNDFEKYVSSTYWGRIYTLGVNWVINTSAIVFRLFRAKPYSVSALPHGLSNPKKQPSVNPIPSVMRRRFDRRRFSPASVLSPTLLPAGSLSTG